MKRQVRPELVEFGQRLRDLRKAAGLTQEQLAMKAGLERAYVSSAETGRRNATLTTLYQLASALGIDVSDLVRDTGAGRNGK